MPDEFNVDVYKRGAELIFVPQSKNKNGKIIEEAPEYLSANADAATTGNMLLASAKRVRQNADAPATMVEDVVKAMKEKSWRSFIRKVTLCIVRRKNGSQTLIFYAGKREKGGFVSDIAAEAAIDDHKSIGEAILKCVLMYQPG